MSSISWGATFTVTPTSDNDCSDYDCDLQSAFNTAAQNGEDDTINIAVGTYAISTSYSPVSGENYSLTLQGAGAGLTVLDGGGTSQIMAMDTSTLADDSNAHITIGGITFLNGNESNVGGGLEVRTVLADMSVGNSEFNGNAAVNGGGGVWAVSENGAITLTGNTFSTNVVSTRRGGGADVYSASGVVTITGNTFSGNTANLSGGGLAAESDSTGIIVIISNSFSGNTGLFGGGAAAFSQSGTVTIMDNILTGNSASPGGGGVSVGTVDGTVNLSRNTFNGNSASDMGGGLVGFAYKGTLTLVNNAFGKNTADEGGGAAVGDFAEALGDIIEGAGALVLTNNTFNSNSANVVGGGLLVTLYYNDSQAKVFNNIVWNNSAPSGSDIYVIDDGNGDNTGSTADFFNNDFSDFYSECENTGGCTDATEKQNNIDSDPLFADVSDPDPGNWDLHLTAIRRVGVRNLQQMSLWSEGDRKALTRVQRCFTPQAPMQP